MVSVYVPYVNINNFLIDQFGAFEYRHYSTVLVEKLLNDYTKNDSVSFFINVATTHFEIIVSKDKKLLLYNTFTYKTSEDFIYYILFAVEQLKLNVEDISVVLLGEIKKQDALFKIVYKYIRNVSFLEEKSKYSAILQIEEQVKRENFTLFKAVN